MSSSFVCKSFYCPTVLLWDCKDNCFGTSEDLKYEVNEQSAVTKVPIAATDSTDSGHVAPTDKGIEFCRNTISDLYILQQVPGVVWLLLCTLRIERVGSILRLNELFLTFKWKHSMMNWNYNLTKILNIAIWYNLIRNPKPLLHTSKWELVLGGYTHAVITQLWS